MKTTIQRAFPVPAALAALLLLSACGGSEPVPAVAESTAAVSAPVAAIAVPPAAEPAPAAAAPAALWQDPFPPAPAAATTPASAAVQPASARDFRAETVRYIGYFKSIRLTPEQEQVKQAALTKIPAPCCSENSIATCCCPCNMAKAVWGLSAHLIVEEGYDAGRLEKAVRDWLAAANPNGFSGKACYTGGCARSIQHDGCAGMSEESVL